MLVLFFWIQSGEKSLLECIQITVKQVRSPHISVRTPSIESVIKAASVSVGWFVEEKIIEKSEHFGSKENRKQIPSFGNFARFLSDHSIEPVSISNLKA
jgi:hypothetical protein